MEIHATVRVFFLFMRRHSLEGRQLREEENQFKQKKKGKNIHSQPARTKKYRIHTDWTPQARNFI
jgi:pyruvate dehydrogenase complex dehydrogenase (E1) component